MNNKSSIIDKKQYCMNSLKGERTKTNVAPRSETTATFRVDTRARETKRLEFYDNSGAVDLR